MENQVKLNMEIIDPELFKYNDPDDEFLYHVTSSPNAERISANEFSGTAKKMFGQSYREHSKNRVFLTEKSGVMFWMSRVEDQLFDQFDEPPSISVLKIQKALLQNQLVADDVGSADSRHPSYFVNLEIINELVRTPIAENDVLSDEFKKWFGKSKIVDPAGKPLRLFHGTTASFSEFETSLGWFGEGMYFTESAEMAAGFADDLVDDEVSGQNIIPVFLSIEKPYMFTEKDTGEAANVQLMREIGLSSAKISSLVKSHDESSIAITNKLAEKGFDGLCATFCGDYGDETEYVAFYSDQIKFAIAKNWDYDIEARLSMVMPKKKYQLKIK